MADRIYKGTLVGVNNEAFPEASDHLDKAHAGGLVPFDMLKEVLGWQESQHLPGWAYKTEVSLSLVNGSIFLSKDDVWVKIDPDGTVEIGTSGG